MSRGTAQSVPPNRRARILLALPVYGALLVGCDAARDTRPDRSVGAEGPRLQYRARLSEDLHRMEVEVCTRAPEAVRFRPGRDEAGARLREARLTRPLPVRRVQSQGGRFDIPAGAGERCATYAVHLRDGGDLSSLVRHTEGGLVASVNAWLFRPERRSEELDARLWLTLPAGAQAFLPYPRHADGSYALDAAAFRFDAYAAFGRFDERPIVDGDARLTAVTLGGALAPSALRSWAHHHLAALAPLAIEERGQGLALIALPSPADAAPFGCVARGGNGAVLVFVPTGVPDATLADDWVLSHELSHFALPFVRREDAWLSEGFATYFQEVLRSRATQRSARSVMTGLFDTLVDVERSYMDALPLADESRRMAASARYRLVYWGGAAIWLAIDIAIQEMSAQRFGLAELAARVRARDTGRAIWSADALLAAIDQELGSPLAVPLARAALSRPFPDFRTSFAKLGVHERDGAIVIDDAAPVWALRAAVFGAE